MNKSDIIDALSAKLRITKKEAAAAIEAVFGENGGIIPSALSKGDNVSLAGFGVFELKKRQSRSARNPKTGETILLPERFTPAFRPAKNLKTKLAKGAS